MSGCCCCFYCTVLYNILYLVNVETKYPFLEVGNLFQILEVSQFEDKVERYKTVEEVTGVVGEIQQYAIVRQQLNKGYLVYLIIIIIFIIYKAQYPTCSKRCTLKYQAML